MSAQAAAAPEVGDPVAAIDTPALVIDLDAMERNLAAMADVRAQPATCASGRTRRCTRARRSRACRRAAGAVGVCVQKTSEAEALADGRHRRHLHLATR